MLTCAKIFVVYSETVSRPVSDAAFRRTILRSIAVCCGPGRMVTGAEKIGENVDRRTT